jgi:UDP-N-acetylmuramoyl-L-alanyl-D-glutamate--2,6-diaminopimelate ligase
MERVEAGQAGLAVVDYAHTPEAVATVLDALRPLTPGRLVVVLGCGGDRDRGKRPLMGAAAVRGSDLAVLTSDNPRSEDPLAILESVVEGARGVEGASFVMEPDRATAIARAVAGLRAGDTVVVAGKGHEQGQDVGGVVRPFDDRVVLAEALRSAVQRGEAEPAPQTPTAQEVPA